MGLASSVRAMCAIVFSFSSIAQHGEDICDNVGFSSVVFQYVQCVDMVDALSKRLDTVRIITLKCVNWNTC